jgi:hypothetical protein
VAFSDSKIYHALGGDPALVDAFCREMDAGRSARELAAWIRARGDAGADISDQNITDFRAGHYAKWRRRREAGERMREQIATAERLFDHSGDGAATAQQYLATLATLNLTDVLEDFDFSTLKAELDDKPKLIFDLTRSIQQLANADVGYRQLRQRVKEFAERKAQLRERIRDLDRIIASGTGTPASRRKLLDGIVAAIDAM